jgi:transcriptional regulator with XRE-family HTH domain
MVNRIRSVPMIFNHVRFGNDILAHRLEMGLTGENVATLAGCMHATLVYKYELAREENPKIQNVLALCNVFDLDVRDYFELER